MQGVSVRSLVRELRSYRPHGMAKNKKDKKIFKKHKVSQVSKQDTCMSNVVKTQERALGRNDRKAKF